MIRASLEWVVLLVLATLFSVVMTPLALFDGGWTRLERLWSGWRQCLSTDDVGL